MIRTKHNDILYHRTKYRCRLEEDDDIMALFNNHKAELIAHSHPDEGRIIPSAEDRIFI